MIKLSNQKQTEALTDWLRGVTHYDTGSIGEGQYGTLCCTVITVEKGQHTYHTIFIEIDGSVHEANP